MEIIKKGNMNKRKPWVGVVVTCKDCDCVFKLDEHDRPEYFSDQREGAWYEIKCPGCKRKVYVDALIIKNR